MKPTTQQPSNQTPKQSYTISLNPNKYTHPYYNPVKENKQVVPDKPKFNFRRHLHKICFAVGVLGFVVPLITNPVYKEDEPEIQRNIKLVSYTLGVAASLVGVANEHSKKTMEQRRFDDMNQNAEYAIERHVKKLKFARDYQVEVIKSDLETLRDAQTAGAYGLPFYPQSLAPIAMSKISQQNQTQELSHNNMGNMSSLGSISQLFTLPQPGSEKVDSEYEEFAYNYVHDKSKHNYLGLLVCGGMGDNKTSVLHKVQKTWLEREPDTIFYICDPKYWLETKKAWRSNWGGLPVYSDVNKLTSLGIPHPSVYADFEPDLASWLKPLKEVMRRRSSQDRDKFTNQEKVLRPDGSFRPIVVIIDDATTLIEKIKNREDKVSVCGLIDDLVTIGRSAGITLVFISHANTASDTGLSTTALRALRPIVGTSFVQDTKSMEWFKTPIQEIGLQKVKEFSQSKARYFATSWQESPYIPSASYTQPDENFEYGGMLDCMIPELTKIWHQTCPDGFLVQFYHERVAESLGYSNVNEMRAEPIDSTNASANQEQYMAIKSLREWHQENLESTSDEVLSKFSEITNNPIEHVAAFKEQIDTILELDDTEFEKMFSS